MHRRKKSAALLAALKKYLSLNSRQISAIKTTRKKDASTLSKAVSSLSCLFTTGDQAIVGLFGEKRCLSLDDAG